VERFIVGTGRCGSTLLNNMLAKHPDMAVMSEFFAAVDREIWQPNVTITGGEFSRMLGQANVHGDIMVHRGTREKEILTDLTGLTSLPALFIGMIPSLSDTPDLLLAEVLAKAATFPEQPVSRHVTDLFDWLVRHLGKKCWIERSGPSIQHLPYLVDMYPDALFVHLHRDGAEVALSMQRHQYFQLDVSFFFDPPTRADIEDTEIGGHPVTDTDTFSRRLTDVLPAEKFGEFWSLLQIAGARGLARLDPSQVLDVRFEDLVTQPGPTMERIASFLALPERQGWIDAAAQMVAGGMPPTRLEKLPKDEQDALLTSCRIGRLLLGREDLEWTMPTQRLIREVAQSHQREGAGRE
jgi:hypothetical protein